MSLAVHLPFKRRTARHTHEHGGAERARVRVGDYIESGLRLYRVEYVRGDRVLLEDCISEDLFDAAADDVEQLRLVKR
jgi:hypothetical protein